MAAETLIVPRAGLDLEEPWKTPRGCDPVRLRLSGSGETPRLSTDLAVWYDAEFLTILFSGADDLVVASHRGHDQPLYEHDVVEMFLAPSDLRHYFEIEVNPLGTVFDARIDSPDGLRPTMDVDRAWNCEGLVAAIRKTTYPDGGIASDTLVRIPFRSLGEATPREGDVWRANFFRIDRHPERGDEFSAWQPTLREPADFHVAAAFGTLRFRA